LTKESEKENVSETNMRRVWSYSLCSFLWTS